MRSKVHALSLTGWFGIGKADHIYFDDPKEVEVSRRRQSGSGKPPTPRRAEAPSRQTGERQTGSTSGGGGYTGSGGGGFSTGGGGGFSSAGGGLGSLLTGGGGGKKPKIPFWLIILLAIVCIAVYIFSNSQQPQDQDQYYQEPAYQEEATEAPVIIPTSRPTRPPSTGGDAGQRWLVMLYQDADDKILERDIMMDLNEVEKVGSSDQVTIISQIDRYSGGYSGDGNWASTRRYFMQQDDDLLNLNSAVLDDLGEVNMADGDSLVDFVTWSVQEYPSDKYVLILSDHGMGWPGGWSDASTRSPDSADVPIASAIGDNIFLMEMDDALARIQSQTGIDKFEMIGLDACLMSDLAVYTMLEPYARYAVASQETEPGIGWAYTSFLQNLVDNPGIDGADLGNLIVDSYVREDQRLIDDRARADFLSQSNPMASFFGGGSVMSAAQLQAQLERDITLTAVDLGQIPHLNQAVNDLAYALQGEKQNYVAKVRTNAQSYTSVWGSDVQPSYLDLGHLTRLLINENISVNTISKADRVQSAIASTVIAEKHGQRKSGSNGISVYFPNSSLYKNDVAGATSYTMVAERFAKLSLWDDFLAYHYTGRSFDAGDVQAVMPSRTDTIKGPGTGKISISPITLSSTTASPDSPVKMSATITGDNIGYVYLFVGYLDEASNSIFPMDMDYLESQDTRQESGVYYPVWPEDGSFKMSLTWEPTVFAVSDGTNREWVMLTPQSYGASADDAVYTVDGLYTFADSGEQKHARLYFSGGSLTRIFGFTDQAGMGAPREITPRTGDTFAVEEKLIDLTTKESVSQYGATLTFGNVTFTWEEAYAPAGEYVVGFIVKDMDGNTTQQNAQITVE